MRLSDDNLCGRTVICADGNAIGSLAELFITADWRVEAIRVELRNEIADRIGATRTLLHRGSIEIPVGFIQSAGDAIVLTIAVDQLREVHRAVEAGAAQQAPEQAVVTSTASGAAAHTGT